MHTLRYHKLHASVPDLSFATNQSVCFDLRAFFGPGMRDKIVSYNSVNQEIMKHCYVEQTDENFNYHVVLYPTERILVPTGIIFDLDKSQSIRIHSRSGLSLKCGIVVANGEGIVDSDYREQTYVMLTNLSASRPFRINHGDRIAQGELVIVPEVKFEIVMDRPQNKENRTGGFGSTGIQ